MEVELVVVVEGAGIMGVIMGAMEVEATIMETVETAAGEEEEIVAGEVEIVVEVEEVEEVTVVVVVVGEEGTVVVVDVVEVTKATMEETTILRIFVIFLDLMINLAFHSTSHYCICQ